jgi:hypothetical protein
MWSLSVDPPASIASAITSLSAVARRSARAEALPGFAEIDPAGRRGDSFARHSASQA